VLREFERFERNAVHTGIRLTEPTSTLEPCLPERNSGCGNAKLLADESVGNGDPAGTAATGPAVPAKTTSATVLATVCGGSPLSSTSLSSLAIRTRAALAACGGDELRVRDRHAGSVDGHECDARAATLTTPASSAAAATATTARSAVLRATGPATAPCPGFPGSPLAPSVATQTPRVQAPRLAAPLPPAPSGPVAPTCPRVPGQEPTIPPTPIPQSGSPGEPGVTLPPVEPSGHSLGTYSSSLARMAGHGGIAGERKHARKCVLTQNAACPVSACPGPQLLGRIDNFHRNAGSAGWPRRSTASVSIGTSSHAARSTGPTPAACSVKPKFVTTFGTQH